MRAWKLPPLRAATLRAECAHAAFQLTKGLPRPKTAEECAERVDLIAWIAQQLFRAMMPRLRLLKIFNRWHRELMNDGSIRWQYVGRVFKLAD